MSEHLNRARKAMSLRDDPMRTANAIWHLIAHLETETHQHPVKLSSLQTVLTGPAQAGSPATEKSEAPSSLDTETQEATPSTWSTSSTWSSHVSPGGSLPRSVAEAISGWLSSLSGLGPYQEVEIGVTLTSKGPTSPGGSPSPSTQPVPESVSTSSSSSGAHGEAAHRDTSSVSGPEWVKRKTWVADWNFYQIWSGKECIADFLSEERADQIIADHKAAEALAVAREVRSDD